MDFTGERYIPDLKDSTQITIEHTQRYLSIKEFIKGKVVLDAACGEGYGTDIISTHAQRVYGIDICKEAIEQAKEKYKADNIEFKVCSIDNIKIPDQSIDVVVSFETIEHVSTKIQKDFLKEVKRVLKPNGIFIVSTPNKKIYSDIFSYSNEFHVKEFYVQEFKDFLFNHFEYVDMYNQGFEITSLLVNNNARFLKVANNNSNIEGKYVVAVCSNQCIPIDLSLDSIMINNIGKYIEDTHRTISLQNKLEELSQWGQHLDREKNIYIENLDNLKIKNKNLEEIILDKKDSLAKNSLQINKLNNDAKHLKEQILNVTKVKNKEIKQITEFKDKVIKEITEFKDKEIKEITEFKDKEIKEITELKDKEIKHLLKVYKTTFQESEQYQKQLQRIYNSNLWKFALKYYRLRDKLKITRWLQYKLNKKARVQSSQVEECIVAEPIIKQSDNENRAMSCLNIEQLVKKEYTKQDIIVLSVIDWNFRFQRPQHLAKNMAKLGHRVFYFNANYSEDKLNIKQEEENLYIATLSNYYGQRIYDIDFKANQNVFKDQINRLMHEYNIRDCSVIVEYPTWGPVASYVKGYFGGQIIFDYIDDYTGFEETNNKMLIETTKELLKKSDLTIATSIFLADKAKEYATKVEIIRNGTEFEFFNLAQGKVSNKRPKIGYYGAIAEWFDMEKIQYIAEQRPDIDIELIGHVSDEKCYILKKYKNVTFLGEKDYRDLTKYLKDYNVCLIPFRSDIDLIRATNPVKFYEYLSAGKKIVSTEIPELEPFRDKYVYLANEKEQFLNYVDRCLKGTDELVKEDELIRFAKTQDWISRCEQMEQVIKDNTPLVSVILVTYNNLHYTKQCIDSILNKTAYPNYEIVIVDNKSQDETPQYLLELQKEYEHIHVILNTENSGFAGGNNIGIKACKGEYIILLNNDTLVTRGWITGLIKHLDKENIGMVGPVTNSIGNESQINITYSNIEDMDKFAIQYTTEYHNVLYTDIRVLAMFCVVIKKKILDEVGLLDENYKVGMFEDDDYSMALKKQGYEVVCADDVFIHHFGNASFKKLEDKKYQEIFNHNKNYFEKKWNVVWTPHKYREGVKL